MVNFRYKSQKGLITNQMFPYLEKKWWFKSSFGLVIILYKNILIVQVSIHINFVIHKNIFYSFSSCIHSLDFNCFIFKYITSSLNLPSRCWNPHQQQCLAAMVLEDGLDWNISSFILQPVYSRVKMPSALEFDFCKYVAL